MYKLVSVIYVKFACAPRMLCDANDPKLSLVVQSDNKCRGTYRTTMVAITIITIIINIVGDV